MRWVIPSNLARSSRPGYRREGGGPVSQDEVDEWLSQLRREDITAIICLLDDELALYSSLPCDLVSYYRQKGFAVEHVRVADYAEPPLRLDQLGEVWQAYMRLPKPVLIHCSAGLDRTGLAVSHILSKSNHPAE